MPRLDDHPFAPLPTAIAAPPTAIRQAFGAMIFSGMVLLALASLTGCGTEGGSEPGGRPAPLRLQGAAEGYNVLLLSVDTVRADRLNSYGYAVRETSPKIDRMLTSGVLFERAVAPRSLTWPSLATVLTGLYPAGHGVIENGWELPADVPILSEVLQRQGYTTGAFLSNMCRAGHRGWDAFRCSGGRDGKTLEWSLEWSDQLSGDEPADDRPFFLWVHLFAAHGPYYNGGDLAATRFDPDYEGFLAPRKGVLDRVMTEPVELTPRDVEHLDALYDAAVAGTDFVVGELLAGLEERGLLERTLVVFLSDHGEELYQHNGYLYHACSVYESTLHVPLGITGLPELQAGGRVAPPVELADVAPTLYDLLGLGVEDGAPTEFHGVSLVPYLARPDARGRGKPAFSDYGSQPLFTVQAGGWKLIHNPTDYQPYCFPGAPQGHYPLEEVELYHLPDDPLETTNLAASEPARVAELTRLIEDRFQGLARRDATQEIPEELRKQLEALGYVAP